MLAARRRPQRDISIWATIRFAKETPRSDRDPRNSKSARAHGMPCVPPAKVPGLFGPMGPAPAAPIPLNPKSSSVRARGRHHPNAIAPQRDVPAGRSSIDFAKNGRTSVHPGRPRCGCPLQRAPSTPAAASTTTEAAQIVRIARAQAVIATGMAPPVLHLRLLRPRALRLQASWGRKRPQVRRAVRPLALLLLPCTRKGEPTNPGSATSSCGAVARMSASTSATAEPSAR